MVDYRSLIRSDGASSAATSGVTGSIEDSPDDAARAFELAQSSGIPADQIYGNLDSFQRFHKASMASQLVQGNPYLQDYANSHPLAPTISNDDWGTLDTVSQHMQKLPKESSLAYGIRRFREAVDYPIDATAETLKEGFGNQRLGSWIPEDQFQELQQSPQGRINYALAALAGSPIEVPLRAFNALTHTVGAVAGRTAKMFGADDQSAAKTGASIDEATGLALMHMGSSGVHVPPELNAIARQAQRTAKNIKPYVDAGIEPPLGVDPATDEIKAKQAKFDADALKQALSESQKSTTRERNPDLYRNFIRQHTDAEIGISSEAVRKLYGETTPMPDDGLLGLVPGIEDQLIGTRETGGDIKVPLADWLAHVEPEVANELHDHIRVRSNGLTLDEIKNIQPRVEMDEDLFQPPQPKSEAEQLRARLSGEPVKPSFQSEVEGIIDNTRDSAGLGYKVRLERTNEITEGDLKGTHEFDFVDRDGKPLGDIQLTDEGKNLHVDYMRAKGGIWAFGPQVVADIFKQLREAFPEARTISGDRISGAREKLQEDVPIAERQTQRIYRSLYPLSQEGHDLFHELAGTDLQPSEENWIHLGMGVHAQLADKLTEREQEVFDRVDAELKKLAPRLVEAMAVRGLKTGGDAAIRSHAVYYQRTTKIPIIAWAFSSPDAVGSVRHEAIHHLRQTGFFTPAEWRVLRDAAIEENWRKKYNIGERYRDLSLVEQLEEAVAEHFAHWNRGEYEKGGGVKPQTALDKVLYKIAQVYNAIREAVRSVLGKDADWKDLFQKVEKGEIGSRRGVEPIHEGAYRGPTYQRPEQGELDVTRTEDKDLFAKANAVGMTVKAYKKYLELLEKKDREDSEFAKAQTLKNAQRRQTQEWKANEKRIKDEVGPGYENRPDIAADRFLGEGVLYGEKVRGRPRLDEDLLTAEQKSMLDEDSYGPGGLHPDDVAGLFGYDSGGAMLDRLGKLHQTRRESGLSRARYNSKLVSDEVERRMRIEHGDLAQNILDEVQDHVVSQTQFDILHEETLAAATRAGMEMSLTKEDMQKLAKQNFARMTVGQVGSVEEHLRDALRANELAERALLDGDPVEAFKQKQKQLFSFLYAREAKRFEKDQAALERIAKRFTQRVVENFPSDFTNAIHSILMKVGLPVKRTVADLAKEYEASNYKDLRDFVEKRNVEGQFDGTVLPVPDFLMDGQPVKLNNLSTSDYLEVKQALDALTKQGRDFQKVMIRGEKEDLRQWVKDGEEQLAMRFPVQKYPATQRIYDKAKMLVRQYIAAITNMETFFGRLDGQDRQGRFTKAIVYPAAEAANHYAKLQRQFANIFSAMVNLKNAKEKVTPPFMDPRDGQPWQNFTRKNLEGVIANIGNDSNLKALMEGYDIYGFKQYAEMFGADAALGITKPMLMAWIEKNTTKADIKRAQIRGDAFKEAKALHDTVERNVNGVASTDVEPTPFTMHGEQFDGWYHPIIDDQLRGEKVHQIDNAESEPHTFWPTVATGFTKERTGATHVLDLNIDMSMIKLNQILHAIAFKEFVHNTNKIFRDSQFREAIRTYYGDEYIEEMNTWLKDIAGNASYDSKMAGKVAAMSNYFRQNVMTTYIGFNPYTVQKHGLSAWVMSSREVGFRRFAGITAQVGADFVYHAMADLFTKDPYLGNTLWKFIHDNSEEIQRRDRNWKETMMGQQDLTYGRSTLRNSVAQWGSKAVALSDMISAAPLWLARYREAFAEFGERGPAIDEANAAVRRAHGSTAITNLPRFVRRAGPLGSWMTSIYGFMGTIMQRRIEIAHDLNDIYHLGREGEIKQAAKRVPDLLSSTMAYYIWPTLVTALVSKEYLDSKHDWSMQAVMHAIEGFAEPLLFIRDLVYGAEHNREPAPGLAAGPAEDFTRMIRDFQKTPKFGKQNAGKLVGDTLTAIGGDVLGVVPKTVANAARFGIDYAGNTQRPKSFPDWFRGITRGNVQRVQER